MKLTIPKSKLGRRRTWNEDGSPCCTLGHLEHALGLRAATCVKPCGSIGVQQDGDGYDLSRLGYGADWRHGVAMANDAGDLDRVRVLLAERGIELELVEDEGASK